MKRIAILCLVIGACLGWGNFAAADLTLGLVANYPFTGNANDASGNANHGTVSGAVLTNDRYGNPDSAYYFNGATNFIQVPHRDYLNINQATGFTVAAWFRFVPELNAPTVITIIDKSHGASLYTPLSWAMSALPPDGGGNRLLAFVCGDGSSFPPQPEAPFPGDGKWHHCAGTLVGSEYKLYVDGTLASSIPYNTTPAGCPGDLFIGKHYELGRYFGGDIDEVRIYNRALSAEEIRQLATYHALPPLGLILD